MLSVGEVHAFYGNIEALKGVDLEIAAGEIVALIGANGAGKSTLLMTICGRPRAARGRILFDGTDITRLPTFEIVRLGIAQAPEGRRIFPRMSVLENLQIGATTADPARFEADCRRIFSLFPVLEERQRQRGGTLSGGEQAMLAAGRALVGNPTVLLMDEPSEGLAPLLVRELGRIIGDLRRDGASILLVEQNLVFALRVADHVYIMSKGRIVVDCAPDELRRRDDLKSRWLGV